MVIWRVKAKMNLASEQAPRAAVSQGSSESLPAPRPQPISVEETGRPPEADLGSSWYLDAGRFSWIGSPLVQEEVIYINQPPELEPGLAYGREGLEYVAPLSGDISLAVVIDLEKSDVSPNYSAASGMETVLSISVEIGPQPRIFQVIYIPQKGGPGEVVSSVGESQEIPLGTKQISVGITRLGEQFHGTLSLDDAEHVDLGVFNAGDFDDARGQPMNRMAITAMRYDPAAQGRVSFALRSLLVTCLNPDDSCK